MCAAEACVEQVRGDGACGELDGDVFRCVHPSAEVVVSCAADKVVELIAWILAHILGRRHFQSAEQPVKLGS